MKVQLLNDELNNKWDEYVRLSKSGTFSHLSGWKIVLKDVYNFKPYYLTALDDSNSIAGILPMFLMKNIFGKRFLVSSPYTTSCGICADNVYVRDELINKAIEIAAREKVQYIELRSTEEMALEKALNSSDFAQMTLDMTKKEDHIWNKVINCKVRNSVRKGVKGGMTFDYGKKYLDDFYDIFATNMRDLGTPAHSRYLFKKILEVFDEHIEIFVVKYEEKVVGGMFCFTFNNVISEPWASTLKEYNRLCAADFLYWETIKHACNKGFEYFDFGRSTVGCGTYRFKKKWGAKPTQLYYIYILNTGNCIPVVNAFENKYHIAIKIWQKLPCQITNFVGPILVKYLPEL